MDFLSQNGLLILNCSLLQLEFTLKDPRSQIEQMGEKIGYPQQPVQEESPFIFQTQRDFGDWLEFFFSESSEKGYKVWYSETCKPSII